MVKCPNCGQQINPGAHFCSRCGSVVQDEDQNAGAVAVRSRKRIVGIAISIAVVLIGAVAGFTVYNALNKVVVKEIAFNGDAPVVLGGDTAVIVHGEDDSVLDAYDITLTDEEGTESAYHVDGAAEGYLISDLPGVENGTYQALVTNRETGNSCALGEVAVSKGSETRTVYEYVNSANEDSPGWCRAATATVQLARCSRFQPIVEDLIGTYGGASTVSTPDVDHGYPAGLCFAKLADIDGDQEDELIVVPVDGDAIKRRLSAGVPVGYGWDDPGRVEYYDIDEETGEVKKTNLAHGGVINAGGFGKIGFVDAGEEGQSLITYHLGMNRYDVWDLTGHNPVSTIYEVDHYPFPGTRAGKSVSTAEAEEGIKELCSSATFYLLADPQYGREVASKKSFSYEETIDMTDETLAFINDADERLFVNPHKSDKAESDKR